VQEIAVMLAQILQTGVERRAPDEAMGYRITARSR